MAKINLLPTPFKYQYSDEFESFVITGAKVVGKLEKGIIYSLSLLNKGIELSQKGNLIIYNGFENFPKDIEEVTKELFEEKYAKEQGYYLVKKNDEIIIAGYEEAGCMYALMTLLQLFDGDELPSSFEIFDRPDFRIRGNKWLFWVEAGIWSYDRGDGIEKYKERIIKKLDMCLKYKVNLVVYDDFGFKIDRFEGYNELMKEVSREARKRKVRLMSSGYGMGYGLAGHGEGIFQGAVHYNRKSYPDGEIYKCIGTYDLYQPPENVVGREYGTCLSNDALLKEKLKELNTYIKTTEPGAIYMHNMDADYILEPLWLARCDECRKKWPNDCLWAEDGCAGAFAYFIRNLYKGLCEIKSDDGDYEFKRDCILSMVSPGYIYMNANDVNFEKARKFWQKVSELIEDEKNFYVLFRENYYNHDDNRLRIDLLREGWTNGEIGVVGFFGGDGYYSDKLFLGSGLFHKFFLGASQIITENGNGNQEPLQLCNAEYMWNSANSAYYNVPDIPDNYKDFEPFYIDYLSTKIRPNEIYGEGGLLEIICEKLYGKDAAKDFWKLYSIKGENNEAPLMSPCSVEIFTNFTKKNFVMRWDNDELVEEGDGVTINSIIKKFEQINIVTKEAKELTDRIYNEKKYYAELDEDVKWLVESFTISSKIVDMLTRYMHCYKIVNRYFTNNETEGLNKAKEILTTVKAEADEFMKVVVNMNLKAINPLGGAIVRREEMCDFVSYNCEIMLRSIEENKRLPSNLRPLKVIKHW